MEESLNLYSDIQETKASRKTETLNRQRKIPSDMGIFQRRFIYLFFFENIRIISFFMKIQNFFLENFSASTANNKRPAITGLLFWEIYFPLNVFSSFDDKGRISQLQKNANKIQKIPRSPKGRRGID